MTSRFLPARFRFSLLCAPLFLGVGVGVGAAAVAPAGQAVSLRPIGTYTPPVYPYDQAAAEIVAHDPGTQRLFVVNAQAATVDVLSIADPATPTKVGAINVEPYGAVANSVAVRNGIVAVAVENTVKTSPGRVVFFGANLQFLAAVEVGALPDMLTFTPDGRHVLVANEGEPNADYSVDPEGSVSIIDVSGDLATLSQASVRTAGFRAFNAPAVLDASIRIFGVNTPTVAEDLEPEYITVSEDSTAAWVTLQENNAIATIDIATATVTVLRGLGFKNHAQVEASSTIYTLDPANLPVIGRTLGGQNLRLGGFSGLFYEGKTPQGRLKFVTHTDRGPNAEPNGIRRPFLLPDFAPEIVRLELDPTTGEIELMGRIKLKRNKSDRLTGLPNTKLSTNANQAFNDEVPVDLLGRELPLDEFGADLEGIVVAADGSFWMVDEYRPAIYHFDPSGKMLQRYVPEGTAAAAGQPVGTYGIEALPAVLAQRRQNRGFEAIAWDNGKIYAFVQSPLRNPTTLSNGALNGMTNVRVVEFDPVVEKTTRQFIYVMDNPDLGGATNTRADKLGDAVGLGKSEFLVVERDDDALPDDPAEKIEKKIYRFNLNGATDVSGFTGTVGTTGKTVDQLTTAELVANKINPIFKMLHVDLNQAGYNRVQKVEGLAVIDQWTLAVINDNDFGVAGILPQPDGSFILAPGYVPEKVELGLIDVRLNGMDASDADSAINIRQWPVKGVYMPDALASYKVGQETYLVTANEGDAREYISGGVTYLNEVVRIGSNGVVLDATAFPNPAPLKAAGSLGRLNITNTMGRDPISGKYRELFSFGGRSFSIWKTDGTLVFDSGDELEWLTALAYPANFNASNSNNNFDNRSDDKGPEPEGVVVGSAFGRHYAFIGLERIGGVAVFDVTDPKHPVPVTYSNPRNFGAATNTPAAGDLGPEGLVFIKAEQSPNGKPLLVVGNEISGSTTVYEVEARK